jgi:ABC-type transport system involved in multi-copper enzyme maturation permease subunit
MSRPAIALMRKDLRITRVLWAPMAFSYGVFLLMLMENIWVYAAAAACLAFVAAATALGIDEYYKAEPFLAALPGTRRALVMGRYLAWGVVTTACLGLFFAFTALIPAGFGERAPHLATLISVKGAAIFLAGTVLAGLVFLPFHFRFGFWRGMGLFTATGFVLSIIALNAAAILVPTEAFGADSASSVPGALASTGRGLRALAWTIDSYLDKPPIVGTAAVILTLLVYLSYRLSLIFYRNRDL